VSEALRSLLQNRVHSRELVRCGYTPEWFDSRSREIQLTVALLFMKLSALELWRFVGEESSTGRGTLEFLATDVASLKRELCSRNEFTRPSASKREWSSRELVSTCSLHFKHFPNWVDSKVQAHIDPIGLFPGRQVWRHPMDAVVLLWRHVHDPEGYKELETIQQQLLAAGLPPERWGSD
jgi:hypothetical protein